MVSLALAILVLEEKAQSIIWKDRPIYSPFEIPTVAYLKEVVPFTSSPYQTYSLQYLSADILREIKEKESVDQRGSTHPFSFVDSSGKLINILCFWSVNLFLSLSQQFEYVVPPKTHISYIFWVFSVANPERVKSHKLDSGLVRL